MNQIQSSIVTSQDIEKSGLGWASIDNFELVQNEPIVVNTDSSNGTGIHWVVMVKLNPRTMYIFDPLGPTNIRTTSTGEKADPLMIHRAKQQGIKTIYYYPHKLQMKDSFHCGQFSQMVAKIIEQYLASSKGVGSLELDDLINEFFDKRPDMNNEDELLRFFGRSRK
jgi:hypothetical protein